MSNHKNQKIVQNWFDCLFYSFGSCSALNFLSMNVLFFYVILKIFVNFEIWLLILIRIHFFDENFIILNTKHYIRDVFSTMIVNFLIVLFSSYIVILFDNTIFFIFFQNWLWKFSKIHENWILFLKKLLNNDFSKTSKNIFFRIISKMIYFKIFRNRVRFFEIFFICIVMILTFVICAKKSFFDFNIWFSF